MHALLARAPPMNLTRYVRSLLATGCHCLRRRPEREAPAEIRRILVLGYAAIGDLIFFLPVLEALRRHYPGAKIVFLANPYATTRELVPAMGLADEVWLWEWEGPNAGDPADILRRIRGAGFDLAVLTLSSPAHYFQAALRDIPLRAGHCCAFDWPRPLWARPGAAWRLLKRGFITGEFARRALLNRRAWIERGSEHAVRRNIRLLDALGLPRPASDRPALPRPQPCRSFAEEALKGLASDKKKLAVHLGPPSSQYHKIWPAERFAELCARLARDMPAEIVLVGTGEEAGKIEQLRAACPGLRSVVGRASLLETFAVLGACDFFIGNDTGLAKAAMALGVPTITLFGPSDIIEIGAVWEAEKHLEIRTGIPCSPCARLGMAKESADGLSYLSCGHHDCLLRLDVDFAYAAIRRKYPGAFGGRA